MPHLDDDDLDALTALVEAVVLDRLDSLNEGIEHIMASLADLTAEDAALNDEITAVIQLVKDDTATIAQLQGAIGSGNLTADQQATVDALFAQMTAQHDAIVAALSPPAPVPAPAPAPAPEPAPEPAPVEQPPEVPAP